MRRGAKAEDILEEARAQYEAIAADVKRRADKIQVQSQVILEQGQKHLVRALEETKKAAAAVTSEEGAETASSPEP